MANNIHHLSVEEIEQFKHSPVHYAVARQDHSTLRQILSALPVLPKAGEVTTEEESVKSEEAAERVSAMIDRRDVPGRETPLHLAVRLSDSVSVALLMAAGADWSLQNEHGWSALQEAVCAREEAIAIIITRHYQPMAWAKWCRRLPRIIGAMRCMRDFYMEITFNFESSVIPFISRIAPSDTYRIWKRNSNLRADMTLAGFDGFKIQRSDQTFLFLGEGSEDGKVPPGSLLMLTHKDKEVTNALEGAGAQPSEAEIAQEVAIMSQTNMYRPGIDVTEAELCPQLSWRRQEKSEMVGPWKAKVYDMHHVHVSVRSRRVPGAMTDEELFAAEIDTQAEQEDDYTDLLTEEEKRQLEDALGTETPEDDSNYSKDGSSNNGSQRDTCTKSDTHQNYMANKASSSTALFDNEVYSSTRSSGNSSQDAKKRWFSFYSKSKAEKKPSPSSLDVKPQSNGGVTRSSSVSSRTETALGQCSKETFDNYDNAGGSSSKKGKVGSEEKVREKKEKRDQQVPTSSNNGSLENEYKKGLRPVLWLTPDFPLKTKELLPLLDILANKVKAVRRLRELLTTKLPPDTFPVKVAIPIIPTIRVVVTFNKFEELLNNEEFSTPVSSPAHFSESKDKECEREQSSSGSWLSWIRGSRDQVGSLSSEQDDCVEDIDPFLIPNDYTWIDMKEKKKRLKAKKAKSKKLKKPIKSTDGEVE